MIMPLCVDLAVDGGRPFTMFDDEAMKKILNFAKASVHDDTNLSSDSVKNAVRTAASKKREALKQLLCNHTTHLSLDFATCQHRSFFGNYFSWKCFKSYSLFIQVLMFS